MLFDFLSVKSPKEKKKLNLYLNDNNLYVKNSLKMRKNHISYFNNIAKAKADLKKKCPVPKILYSTSDLNFHKYQKQIIEKFSPKNNTLPLHRNQSGAGLNKHPSTLVHANIIY